MFLHTLKDSGTVSMTWALLELALNPEKQDRLRAELEEFTNKDPSYDELRNGLLYLNAVTREVLRLHPAVLQTIRVVCDAPSDKNASCIDSTLGEVRRRDPTQ